MKNNLENQDIKTDKPLAMSYEALKAERDALLAENVAMREAIEFATATDMWIEQDDGMLDYRYSEWYVDVLNAAIETPSTDAALAAIEARGVEKSVERITILMNHQAPAVAHVINALNILAVELREAK